MVQLNKNTDYLAVGDFKVMAKLDLVYMIDDDEIITYLSGKLIDKADFSERHQVFKNGMEALESLKRAIDENGMLPDVILFDLNMPLMDGWEFFEEYRKLPLEKEIPLFAFTSSINQADRDRAYSFREIKGFIEKPLTIHKLDKILRMII